MGGRGCSTHLIGRRQKVARERWDEVIQAVLDVAEE